MIKVSIIVPIFNMEKFLEKCLQSIQNQTLRELEVICVDDGSTDDSRKIAQKFVESDARFQLFTKPNSGYGNTMNLGLKKAKGEYVGIVESDDFIERDMFEVLYNNARNGDFDVVKGDYYLYWSQPEKIVPANSLSQKNVYDIAPSIWSAIYKRSFLLNNNIQFLETPGASFQDTGFSFKVWSCTKKYKLIHRNFVYYRQDNLNSSVKSSAKIFNICEEFAELERFLPKKESDFFRRRALCYMWNYRRLGKEGREQFYSVLRGVSSEIFEHMNCFDLGLTLSQLMLLWLSAYLPTVFKLVIQTADE